MAREELKTSRRVRAEEAVRRSFRLRLPALGLLILLCLLPDLCAAASVENYTMPEAVQRALSENFAIVSAQASLAGSESARGNALSAFGPSLSAGYTVNRQEHVADDAYSWRISLNQNLFAGFATLASYQKAALQRDNAEAALTQARLSLILQVQQNFLLYLKAEENVRSAQDAYNRLAEQLKVTRSFYEVGLRPRVEVLQAEVNVSEAEDLLLQNHNTVETQRARLNTLLNIPLDKEVRYAGDLRHIPFEKSLEQCLKEAGEKRPDLIIARKSVDIARRDQSITRGAFLPELSASASWGSTGDDWKAAGSSQTPRNYSSWSLGLTASISLFESGRDYFNLQRGSHNISKMLADEAQLRQEVIYEVQSRLLDLDNAQKRIAVARKGLEQAAEAYRVAAARYKSQVGTSIDVLDAQARLTDAEASLTNAQGDYLSALAALYAAIGTEQSDLRH
jgi:outer membrane protein